MDMLDKFSIHQMKFGILRIYYTILTRGNSIGFDELKSEVTEQYNQKISNNIAFAEQI